LAALLDTHRSLNAHLIVVSNEVGLGVVPPYSLGRTYRDCLGRANQALARVADRVILMVAGLPVDLKALPLAQL
jgi:adenosylcobinamide kinase/adenosylcobinamide-phosphate guanylyltransferase